MNAEQAYAALVKSGHQGMDDPDKNWGTALRWYFDATGVLCACTWRGHPHLYPDFIKPAPVIPAHVDIGAHE